MAKHETDQYYEVLELEAGASLEEIKRAYRDLVKVWHPDRFTHDLRLQEKAQEKLKTIIAAYDTLVHAAHNNEATAHARYSQPPSQPPKNKWILDLKNNEVVRIVDVHPEDSYFTQRNGLLGMVIRVWGDVYSKREGWYCIRASIQAPNPASHQWSSGDVIYFTAVRVSRG